MIIFNSWFGRLGNNIIQLKNVIQIAFHYKHKILFRCSHPFFDVRIIERYFSNNVNNQPITDKNHFFYRSKIKHISPKVFQHNNKETINLLKHAFIIKDKDINILNDDDVVIHIRSGDLFSRCPHPSYVPPPLSYYTSILSNIKYDKIIIVCEDKLNPVVDQLLKIYAHSIHSVNCLRDDIKIILGAKNIISSVGTFVPSLTMLSSNILKEYNTSLYKKELKQYYICNKPWKNTKIQRDNIINYQTPTSPLTADDVIITSGGSGALEIALKALLNN